jgi:acetyl esterase
MDKQQWRPFKVYCLNLLAQFGNSKPKTPEEIIAYRKRANDGGKMLTRPSLRKLQTKIIEIPTRGKHKLPTTIYSPIARKPDERLPIVIYFHGGGWVLGGSGSHEELCADISREANLIVAAVDYRLAPETKFPGAQEDAYDASKWIYENAEIFQGDSKFLMVAGDSAGGNLATTVCHMAKSKENYPPIRYQVLIYPSTDAARDTPSYQKYAHGYFYDKDQCMWFGNQLFSEPSERMTPLASPLRQKDFSNLPPAFVLIGEMDILHDEGKLYAEALQCSGVPCVLSEYKQTVHGFMTLSIFYREQYQKALKEIVSHLKQCITS